MISWYIDSSQCDDIYLSRVKKVVQDCMDYFCNKLSNISDVEIDDIEKTFESITNELPILTFLYNKQKDEFYFRYNRSTLIKLNDPLKLIKRDIILDKILNANYE